MSSNTSQKTHYVSVSKQPVNFRRKGLPYGNVVLHVNYEEQGDFRTGFPWWTNEMDRTALLNGPEEVYLTVAGVNGTKRSRLVRTEQESVGWMQKLVGKIFKPDEPLVNPFPATFAMTTACLELSRCGLFEGCKVYAKYFPARVESLIETYSRQDLNEKFDISGSGELVDEFKIVVRRVTSQETNKIVDNACRALTGADVYIADHALSFEYLCGSVFICKRPSDSFDSVVVYVTGEVSSVESRDDAYLRVQRHPGMFV